MRNHEQPRLRSERCRRDGLPDGDAVLPAVLASDPGFAVPVLRPRLRAGFCDPAAARPQPGVGRDGAVLLSRAPGELRPHHRGDRPEESPDAAWLSAVTPSE